jgi:phospho-N-acetylmuramoyl-pentapeptide-transferase
MGDVGSLAIGGVFGVAAVLIHKELLLPLLCGVFFMESLSTIIQRVSCKITRKLKGEPIRVWSCAPLHHHFQKVENYKPNGRVIYPKPDPPHDEAKISVRFWIVQLILAVLTLALLKIR